MTDAPSGRKDRIRALAVAGGGTGGHLFPGLAIAEEFRRCYAGVRILYLGVEGKMEEKIVPVLGFEFHGLKVRGLKGQSPAGQISSLLLASRALVECRKILKTFGPELVVGVGGYSSGPAALAARSLGIPLVLQEQNTVPGLTNRLLGRLAQKVFIAFEEAADFFPRGRTVVTGNPVRRDALATPAAAAGDGKLKVLVLGGSRGARGLNRIVTSAVALLGGAAEKMVFFHQSGYEDLEWVKEAYLAAGVKARILPFIDGMGEKYGWADLVVSRAGAGAVSEIAASGRPAVLVPYPSAAAGHQRRNALWLVRKGGARLVEESENDSDARMADLLVELSRDRGGLREMAEQSRRAGRRDAAARIVAECCRLSAVQGR